MTRPSAGLAVDQPAHGSLSLASAAGCVRGLASVARLDAEFAARWRADWRLVGPALRKSPTQRNHDAVLTVIRARGAEGASTATVAIETGLCSREASKSCKRLAARLLVREVMRERPRMRGHGVVRVPYYVAVGAGEVGT